MRYGAPPSTMATRMQVPEIPETLRRGQDQTAAYWEAWPSPGGLEVSLKIGGNVIAAATIKTALRPENTSRIDTLINQLRREIEAWLKLVKKLHTDLGIEFRLGAIEIIEDTRMIRG